MFFAGGIIFGGMKDSLRAVWRWVRWPLYVLVVGYVLLVIYDVQRLFDIDKTNEAVAAIHAQKITLADVQGSNLPPVPDQAENDATVAGIDKNNNGVRDDVELAIFKKYPNSAKIRAAELQYAMTTQLMLTKVYNKETWVAAAQEVARGNLCIGMTTEDFHLYLSRYREIDSLEINNSARKTAQDKAYDFTTGHGDREGSLCDIDLKTLPN